MNFLRDTTVLILGLGDSGLAMARWCVRHGAQVSVWDSRERAPQDAALAQELPMVRRLLSLPLPEREREKEREPKGFQLILKSPGLAPHDERIAPLLQQARASGLAVWGELDLFTRALADLKAERGYAPQVLAITGTNGKTTVTAMTALLVARAGKTVVMAGNIGPTLLDTLQQQLDAVASVQVSAAAATAPEAVAPAAEPGAGTHAEAQAQADTDSKAKAEADDQPQLPQVWVLELSSFQLEGGGTGVQGFEPAAATVLNLTQDHLDWHGGMAAYAAAKARIFGQRAVMVVNRDDAAVQALLPLSAAATTTTATKAKGAKAAAKPVLRQLLSFGLGAPLLPGDFGVVEEGGMAWLVRALPADDTFKRKKGDPAEDIHLQRLMPADALRVRGRHNAANALAALALATAIGCALAPMLHGLRDYRGEPHRVQFVQRVDGVDAYDDSKGTNVGATVAALAGLGAEQAPGRLLVILGGDGKGQDFSPLVPPLARHARAVATIGRDAGRIEAAVAAQAATAALPVQRFASLQEATAWCLGQARNGDAVLLSPACASLDMFDNYAHRARVFVEAVQAWAADRGQA